MSHNPTAAATAIKASTVRAASHFGEGKPAAQRHPRNASQIIVSMKADMTLRTAFILMVG
jgi:hypothetical protein